MKSLKQSIAKFLNTDRCISEMSGYEITIELIALAALLILFSLPAMLWDI